MTKMRDVSSDSITLRFRTRDGKSGKEEFRTESMVVNLSNRDITEVNLKPLRSWPNLLGIDLSNNHLKEIDLSPLKSCTKLQGLNLLKNQLEHIDLTPLYSCPSLIGLQLLANKLEEIDLSPLDPSFYLKGLYLNHNNLKEIDLSPLCQSRNLEGLWLSANPLQTIDLSPLSSCVKLNLKIIDTKIQFIDLTPLKNIRMTDFERMEARSAGQGTYQWVSLRTIPVIGFKVKYSRPRSISSSWNFLRTIVSENKSSIRLHNDVLMALGLGHLGLVDTNLFKLLLSIPSNTSFREAQQDVEQFIVNLVANQIDRGWSTMGLDLDITVSRYHEIVLRMDKILSQRAEEIRQVPIPSLENYANLRYLALTVYGNQILRALRIPIGKRLEMKSDDFKNLKSAVKKLGYKLNIVSGKREWGDDHPIGDYNRALDDYEIPMLTDELVEFIWFLTDRAAQ